LRVITLNYVEIPGVTKTANTDITFVASVFGSALFSFGIQSNNNKGGKAAPVNCPMLKKKEV